jgi:hypothetical protein
MAIPGNVGVKKQITSIPSGGPPGSAPTSGAAQTRANISRVRTSRADIARDLDIARGRREFFSNRPDVSDDRALRRMTQADEVQRFKNLYTKPVEGSSNLLQMTADAPMSLSEFRQQTANKYGPTFKEIGSDIGYGIGTFAKAAGDVIMSGDFGLIGFAKGLYEKATTSAAKAKEAVVQGVEKLSDIDLEILKNKDKGKYKFTSKKPEIQQIDALEQEEKGALGLVDAAGKNLDVSSLNATQLATYNMLTKKANPLSHQQALDQVKTQFLDNRSPSQRLEERLGDSQVNLQDIYMQGQKIYDPISVTGNQTMTAGLDESLLPKPIQAGLSTLRGIGETPYGTFGLDDIMSGKPSLTFEKDIFGGTLGATADPFRNQYGFEFSKSFKDGGSVDDKLNNIQKSSNNMYGTGILSAR